MSRIRNMVLMEMYGNSKWVGISRALVLSGRGLGEGMDFLLADKQESRTETIFPGGGLNWRTSRSGGGCVWICSAWTPVDLSGCCPT